MIGINPYLLAFRGVLSVGSTFGKVKAYEEAADRADEYLGYQLDTLRENQDARLEAMNTTFLYKLRDMNNAYAAQTSMLRDQFDSAQAEAVALNIGRGTTNTGSSYVQDVQSKIESEYSLGVNTLATNNIESFKRLEQMNMDAIERTIQSTTDDINKAIFSTYQTKTESAYLESRAKLEGIGQLGTLAILGYSRYNQPTTPTNTTQTMSDISNLNYSLDYNMYNPFKIDAYTNPYNYNPYAPKYKFEY
jgi:hypothetical protein